MTEHSEITNQEKIYPITYIGEWVCGCVFIIIISSFSI